VIVRSVALALLGLAAVWTLGGVLLRGVGILSVLAGALAAATSGDPRGLALAAAGFALWLLGRRHRVLRHGDRRAPAGPRVEERRGR
jgi:hypothetical protein